MIEEVGKNWEELQRVKAELAEAQKQLDYLAGTVEVLAVERDRLREALEKIADPNSYGTSPSEYREIARDALAGGQGDTQLNKKYI